MSKIKLELFGSTAEILSYEDGKPGALVFEFTEAQDGYIVVGSQNARIIGKECAVDLRFIKNGEYTPRLVLMEKTIDLPKIVNENGAIFPSEHSLCEIGELSIRERRLCRRVSELEERLEEISNKVYGARIF